MLPFQFLSQNIHFAIYLLASLVFFSMFWLYFDAWLNKKDFKELIKWLGCILLSVSYFMLATVVEGALLTKPLLGNVPNQLAEITQLLGFLALIIGQLSDPLQPVPKNLGIQKPTSNLGLIGFYSTIKLAIPLSVLMLAILYWRRATTGLERHLKPVAIGFGFVSLSSFISVSSLYRNTSNPVTFNILAPFGVIWWIAHITLLIGIVLLGKWVWQYLVKRVFSQLFITFMAMSVMIFLVTTLSFSFLLVNSVQQDELSSLENSSRSMLLAIDSKQNETTANAEVISKNDKVATAISSKNHDELLKIVGNFIETKKLSSLIIANNSGQVILRAEDSSRWGDSISDDVIFQRAVAGITTKSISNSEDAISPTVNFRSAVPVKDQNDKIIGVVIASIVADTAFVDSIKQATGLDISVYSNNIRSATTQLSADGKTRLIGVKENSPDINKQVIDNGQMFKGIIEVQNQEYLSVLSPLKSHDSKVVGMYSVGISNSHALKTAGQSIQVTFLISALMILLSLVPLLIVAKKITRQVS